MDEFFMYDEEMEQQVNQVKRMLHLSMNGVVSECMSAAGLDYKTIYGVQLPRLKEMAAGLEKNKPLARRLWVSNCREMMLLATMLCPADSISSEEAVKWLSECHNLELVEQLCHTHTHRYTGQEMGFPCGSTLCNPIDGSPPVSSVPGILQARILEQGAISFSKAHMHAKSLQLCPTLCDPMDSSPPGSSVQGLLQARILE